MADTCDETIFSAIENVAKNVKNRRRNAQAALIARALLFVMVATLLALYFFTPVSSSYNIRLSGAYNFKNQDIITLAELKKETLVFVDEKKVESNLQKSPYLEEAKVEWTPTFLKIYINEIIPVAKSEGRIYLSNGETLDDYKARYPQYLLDGSEVPTFLSDFSALPPEGYKIILQSLKKPHKDVYQECHFIDIRTERTEEKNRLIFGFYFESGNLDASQKVIFTRISLYQSDFSYFLNKERYDIIVDAVLTAKNKKIYVNEDTSLSYYDVRCEYNGSDNPVVIGRG